MARVDKYDSMGGGGFRALLAADWMIGDVDKVVPVGLNANGDVVKGAGVTGIKGVVCLGRVILASSDEPVDVMKRGEIVEFFLPATPAPAGSNIYAEPAGDFEVDVAANVAPGSVYIGHTVRSKVNRGARLIVDVNVAITGGTGA